MLPAGVPGAVALLGEHVRLVLCVLLGFVPVEPVEAFCLGELVDFGGGDCCEDFLWWVGGLDRRDLRGEGGCTPSSWSD